MTYRINVSSVQSFMQCRFRWWCEWVMNRVPIATSPALDAGRILHKAFEDYFAHETPLGFALTTQCTLFRAEITRAHPAAQDTALKAVQVMEDLIEAMPLWQDTFDPEETLEVEEAFEWPDPVLPDVIWLGRPDRVVRSRGRIWHMQNRGLAASMNFGTYCRLANRHYHEHLYGRVLQEKYNPTARVGSTKPVTLLQFGGTWFNLVRKLKFRTNVGKKNEATKKAAEMFWQGALSIDLDGPIHRSVMMSLRQHVGEMQRVTKDWKKRGIIPAPNEKLNGGFSGSSEDPFFKVLIGEISLDDDRYFKDREDTYAPQAAE